MRGKKTDPVFISEFIQECVANLGLFTSDDIVKHAKNLIQNIDEEIKSIEKKKITRSKLLDVIAAFEKQSKDKTEEAKLLPFFDLQYPTKCKEICDLLKRHANELQINKLIAMLPDGTTTKFCFKQLLERKILDRKDDTLICGERFNEYMTFVLREAQ